MEALLDFLIVGDCEILYSAVLPVELSETASLKDWIGTAYKQYCDEWNIDFKMPPIYGCQQEEVDEEKPEFVFIAKTGAESIYCRLRR